MIIRAKSVIFTYRKKALFGILKFNSITSCFELLLLFDHAVDLVSNWKLIKYLCVVYVLYKLLLSLSGC